MLFSERDCHQRFGTNSVWEVYGSFCVESLGSGVLQLARRWGGGHGCHQQTILFPCRPAFDDSARCIDCLLKFFVIHHLPPHL